MIRFSAAMLLLAPAVPAQQGTITLPPSYWIAQNISALMPPPDPFMVGVEIEVDIRWQMTFQWEIAQGQWVPPSSYVLDPNGLILGHFDTTLRMGKAWSLDAYQWGVPSASLRFMGGRTRQTDLRLDATYLTPTPWDGVLDWQGPTAQSVSQPLRSERQLTAVPLSLLQSRQLWVSVYSGFGAQTGYQADGWPWHRILDPWTATVTYRYF